MEGTKSIGIAALTCVSAAMVVWRIRNTSPSSSLSPTARNHKGGLGKVRRSGLRSPEGGSKGGIKKRVSWGNVHITTVDTYAQSDISSPEAMLENIIVELAKVTGDVGTHEVTQKLYQIRRTASANYRRDSTCLEDINLGEQMQEAMIELDERVRTARPMRREKKSTEWCMHLKSVYRATRRMMDSSNYSEHDVIDHWALQTPVGFET